MEGISVALDTEDDESVVYIEYLPPEPPFDLEDLILEDLQNLQIVDASYSDGETEYASVNEEGWSQDAFLYSIAGEIANAEVAEDEASKPPEMY